MSAPQAKVASLDDASAPNSDAVYEDFPPASRIIYHGYYQLEFGSKLESNYRTGVEYTILRKLGGGSNATVWMAREGDGDLVAIKVLSHVATTRVSTESRHEIKIMTKLQKSNGARAHCSVLIDIFVTRNGDDLIHAYQCLIQLPVRVVKSFIRQTLIALDHLHSLDFVHTDVKMSNLLVCMDGQLESVADYLRDCPAETYTPHDEPTMNFAKSQPIDIDLKSMSICLADFGEGRPENGRHESEAMPLTLRAPEITLGHTWGKPVDIWAVGCMAFELFTNNHIFDVEPPAGMDSSQARLTLIAEFLGLFPVAVSTGGRRAEFLTTMVNYVHCALLHRHYMGRSKSIWPNPPIPSLFRLHDSYDGACLLIPSRERLQRSSCRMFGSKMHFPLLIIGTSNHNKSENCRI